jgi:hypothetical protein
VRIVANESFDSPTVNSTVLNHMYPVANESNHRQNMGQEYFWRFL